MTLAIKGLTLALAGRPVLQGLDLGLAPGRVLGLTGASGAGKSLLLRAILGVLPPGATLSGSIRLDGAELRGRSEAEMGRLRGARIGMVFQDPLAALDPLMPIGRQIAATVRLHRGGSRAAAREVAAAALAHVGLNAAEVPLHRYPHQLSGGQRQRVAIALATALRPRLLLADEPTTALDMTAQAGILALLRQLAEEDQTAVLMVSHDLSALARVADEIAVLHDGAIVEHGPAASVLSDPRHPFTVRLLAETRPARFRTGRRPEGDAAEVLRVEGLRCEYARSAARPALDGVSLHLGKGEILGVVGESGAGKSTLVRSVLALTPARRGRIRLAGQDFPAATARATRDLRRHVQVVFQDPASSFDPRWRVGDIVAEPLGLMPRAVPAARRQVLVEDALAAVGLPPEAAGRSPHRFSGGQRQRIAIARALVVAPDLIVMDEATSALDQSTKVQILGLLADLVRERDMSLLFVSHDLDAVRSLADRVMVMKDGTVVETGETEQVFLAPRHPYTARLVAAAAPLADILARRQSSAEETRR